MCSKNSAIQREKITQIYMTFNLEKSLIWKKHTKRTKILDLGGKVLE